MIAALQQSSHARPISCKTFLLFQAADPVCLHSRDCERSLHLASTMVPLVATTRKGLISNASSATSTPRISLDEEESAGLLSSFHKRSGSGEDYPPPPSPPTLSLPFKNKTASRSSFTGRSFLALCACVFLVVLSVASYHQTKLRSQASLLDGERIRHSMHDEPVSRLNRTRFLFTDAIMGENYTVTAIVLHGLGQPSDEPPFVRKLANRFPYVRWQVFLISLISSCYSH